MADRILITGGAGTLGKALAPLLREAGHLVRVVDIVPVQAADGIEAVDGDLGDPGAVERALAGCDAVVHAGAWHGVHMRDHPPRHFWDLNVDGTFNVYEAAQAAGLKRAVLCSTMGVYGESRRPGADGKAVRLHEDLPRLPGDIYGTSKVLAEDLAAYYDRAQGIRGVALRFGMFVPEPFLHSGIRFLYGGVDARDVAAGVASALDLLRTRSAGQFTAYNVESRVPYQEEDAALLRSDPLAAIARHWPDAPALLEKAGASLWGPINEWFDISKGERDLNWHPQYGFGEFLEALRDGRESLEPSGAPVAAKPA